VSLYADRPTLCIKDISVGCCYLSKQSFYRTLSFDKISVKKPDPPEPPPAYITDGVSKQDTESLLELQNWIDQLISIRIIPQMTRLVSMSIMTGK